MPEDPVHPVLPKPSDDSREITAFVEALDGVDPSAATRCPGWTAHDLLAHVVAGGEEIRRIVTATLAGEPVGATRGFAGREAPFAAMSPDALRERLTLGGLGLLSALDRLHAEDPTATVAFTGADLTATQLMTHVRSEVTLHRWDLVGDDPTGATLLAQPDLLAHGRWVLEHMPTLTESRHRPADDHDELLVLWGRRKGGTLPACRT